MASRIHRRKRARADLDSIWTYIAADSSKAADALLDRIEDAFEMLTSTPLTGRARKELALNLRSFPVGSHIIFYMSVPDGIEIVRVLHGRQDIDADDMA